MPRGSTALLDAVGRAINETGDRLAKMAEPDRPGLVIFVIVTDGEENASREFSKATIKEMIERQQTKYQLAIHLSRCQPGRLCRGGRNGNRRFRRGELRCGQGHGSLCRDVEKGCRMRTQKRAGQTVSNEFTEEERKKMN